MKIEWHCSYIIFHGFFDDEDCFTDFITDEDQDDWDNECCEAVCPRCGATLNQKDDQPEIIEQEIKK